MMSWCVCTHCLSAVCIYYVFGTAECICTGVGTSKPHYYFPTDLDLDYKDVTLIALIVALHGVPLYSVVCIRYCVVACRALTVMFTHGQ